MTNLRYLACYASDGHKVAEVTRKSENAASNWANKMFRKYGDDVTVEEWQDLGAGFIKTTTWHA